MTVRQVFPYSRNLRVKVLGKGPIYDAVCEHLRSQWQQIVDDAPYDLLVLANYTRYIPQEEIDLATIGTLCFHPSLLPRHRGMDAVFWTIEMGDKETGVTWFWTTDRLDAGPVAIQKSVDVPEGVSPGRLYYGTLVPLGLQAFEELLPLLIRGERPMTIQDESKATYEIARPERVK